MGTETENLLDGATITFNEVSGRLESVEATSQIKDLDTTSLQDAIDDALNGSGLPTVGSGLLVGGEVVVLEDRTGTISQPGFATVKLTWRRQDDTSGGESSNFDELIVGAGVRLLERVDQFDANGDQVTVEHDDTVQGGEITKLVPVSTIQVEWVASMNSPGAYLKGWVGKCNSDNWQDGADGTWIVLDSSLKSVDLTVSPPKWRLGLEFAHDPDGWDPEVIFIDPATGRPPEGLVSGEGYKQVEVYERRNFGSTF